MQIPNDYNLHCASTIMSAAERPLKPRVHIGLSPWILSAF